MARCVRCSTYDCIFKSWKYGKDIQMSDELTVSNPCYQCMIQMELCVDCQDLRDSRATNIAHDLVDEASNQYKHPMHRVDNPSNHEWVRWVNHEWVSPTTRVEPYFVWATQSWEDTRDEFLEPISLLTDRLYELNTDMPPNSMVCQTCHYTCNKHAQCPNCN